MILQTPKYVNPPKTKSRKFVRLPKLPIHTYIVWWGTKKKHVNNNNNIIHPSSPLFLTTHFETSPVFFLLHVINYPFYFLMNTLYPVVRKKHQSSYKIISRGDHHSSTMSHCPSLRPLMSETFLSAEVGMQGTKWWWVLKSIRQKKKKKKKKKTS